ncbi:MAG TPA: hypothetical protein VFE62_28410 [Gemmataceae bacterium]|nr:hypothetical protein [Gemmataceae bacterium]
MPASAGKVHIRVYYHLRVEQVMELPDDAFSATPLPPDPPPPPLPPPNTSIPTTIGILNIVLGSVFLACSICNGINLAFQSKIMAPMMDLQQKQIQAQMEAQRDQQLARLKADEAAAVNEQDKAAVRARQKAVEARPIPKMPNFGKLTDSPTLQAFSITDITTSSVLNLLMLISGIALLKPREWGRVMAIWVALFKIVHAIAIYTWYALAVVPDMVGSMNDMFKEMFEEVGKAGPPGARVPGQAELDQIGMILGIAMTATAVISIFVCAVYPVITLILLTRQRVKDACAATKMD